MTSRITKSHGSQIQQKEFREILWYFCLDISATQIARTTGLNRNTVNKYLMIIRQKIAAESEDITPMAGEVEADESYFGGRKKGDKRGRGTTNKIPVFGIYKRNGRVYTQIIKEATKEELHPIIKRIVAKDSAVYTDGWSSYRSIVAFGYKHYYVNHSKTFGYGKNHINGIENFWGWAKRRLYKFHGISREHFRLHLKECEFRFNHRHHTTEELYGILVSLVKKY